jgi:LPXTG-motif cell wall-anchored protein
LNLSMKQNIGLIAVSTPLLLGMALASPAEAGRTWAGVKAADECVPAAAYTETVTEARTETTGWVTEAPAGLGWVQVDERKVIDVAAVEGVEEGSHTEYRWAIETRTYTPAVEEVSHMETVIDVPAVPEIPEVSHMETVVIAPAIPAVEEVSHVEYKYQKEKWNWYGWVPKAFKTEDNVGNAIKGYWHDNGSAFWSAEVKSDAPFVMGEEHSSSWFRYVKISEKIVIDVEAQPEIPAVTEEVKVIDQALVPAVPAVTHEEKVIDQPFVPAIFGPWEFDDFTAWRTSSVEPADPDAESGADNPLNLVRLDDREENKVVDIEAKAAVQEVSHQEFKFEISFPAVTIEHDAVTCPGEPTPEPKPEPEPDDSSVSNPHPEQLPQTGASDTWLLATGALALLGTGTAALVLVRRRRES